MQADVLVRDVQERRNGVVGLSTGLILAALLILGLTSTMSDTLLALTDDMPEAMLAFVGTSAVGGYAVGELFNLLAPAALVGYAVVSGAGAIAREEEVGTLGLLSAQPVTRMRIAVSKAVGLLGGLVTATAVFFAAVAISEWIFDIGLSMSLVAATCLHLLMLSITFGAIAFAAGAATGRPGPAAGATGGLALAAYISSALLPLADRAEWAKVSPWYYYSGGEPLANGVEPTHLLVLAGITAVALVVAGWAFTHRDLRG